MFLVPNKTNKFEQYYLIKMKREQFAFSKHSNLPPKTNLNHESTTAHFNHRFRSSFRHHYETTISKESVTRSVWILITFSNVSGSAICHRWGSGARECDVTRWRVARAGLGRKWDRGDAADASALREKSSVECRRSVGSTVGGACRFLPVKTARFASPRDCQGYCIAFCIVAVFMFPTWWFTRSDPTFRIV